MFSNQEVELKWLMSSIIWSNFSGELEFDFCVEQFLARLYLPLNRTPDY